jgi:hypothetical protein
VLVLDCGSLLKGMGLGYNVAPDVGLLKWPNVVGCVGSH